ncbi:cysteine desulfurase family protein [Aureimonas phyllosphaerae]|uniref:Cysteine desulfurase n=1 Tax=Aureimonas phyllosphaerae TaxID=1166078 RepID=A0A7W6BX67_9HYPH|nr:cysteine desulfurase family protein [Aureimonas phyllosphaerae]MBB3935381.1 cysteine desulfurase [Aureimonas phyllosphaerae]MBB3959389.1 cysteine desulfurase [Aureimonas phyllosphaerae]SFF03720.1 cysteine desulfurase [Aureimonas phyllosphaerae]
MRVYLDHNASAPLLQPARDAIVAALGVFGNPSSVHTEGRTARSIVAKARSEVAALAGAEGEAVVFTSGATEAASTCLTPHWMRDGQSLLFPRLAVVDTDHPCIREGGRFAFADVTRLPVRSDGTLRLDALDAWLAAGSAGLMAFCEANSETGVVQPTEAIVERCRTAGAVVVCDSVQAAGRMPLEALRRGADAMILSAHKIGGPKGIGAFVLGSPMMRPAPLLTGGAQETRQRAGTEAVPLIAGFGAAAQAVRDEVSRPADMLALRQQLETGLLTLAPEFIVLGAEAPRLPQTVMIHHPALRAETAQIAMDLAGFAVSAGSACSSGKIGGSTVLEAMARGGAAIDPSQGGIRVSFGRETGAAEIDRFLAAFASFWARHAGTAPIQQVA